MFARRDKKKKRTGGEGRLVITTVSAGVYQGASCSLTFKIAAIYFTWRYGEIKENARKEEEAECVSRDLFS
jgi:hypothetical protein